MKTRIPLTLALILGFAGLCFAAADPLSHLDELLKQAVSFEYGKKSDALRDIEQIVVASVKDAQLRPAVEKKLATALAGQATRDGREFLCRQLFMIGSAQSVPALEGLLTDAGSSHMARYVLGRIEDPAAAAALHRALRKTSGKLQVGIIGTLAARQYEPALDDIAKLLSASDADVAWAAATALGQYGGAKAAGALHASRDTAADRLRMTIDDALIACADRFVAGGDVARGVGIYQFYYAAGQPKALRIAALRGLASAGGPDALNLLAQTIKGDDADLRAMAIGFSASAKGPAATKMLADLLPALPAEAQELLVATLGSRGDRSAASAVAAVAKSENQRVQLAACEALGLIGDASSVELLIGIAAKATGLEQRAARASLTRLSGDVNPALVRMLASADAAQRAEACRALAGRRATMAVGELMKVAKANESEVRRAAIAAVGDLAGEGDLPALVALMVSPKEPGDRTAIDQAIKTAFRGIGDPQRRSAPVLAAAQNASGEAKAALLRLLVNAPTDAGLKLVLAALKGTDAAVRDAAVRTLSDWPTADPADQLLAIARTTENPTHQVLAMRGYIRMAGLTSDPTAAYVRAMELAQRADDRKLVLAGLGSASTPAALDLIEKQLADPATQAEAALAAVQVATRLKESDAPRARKALQAVTVAVSEPAIRQKALDVLNDMDKFDGHIRAWVVSEMFKEKSQDGKAAFDAVYPPEKGEASAIQWKPLRRGIGSWGDINLEAMFGTQDYCAAYVRTRIWSPAAQDARLEMGSDDALKAWLNGSLVHGKYQNRGLDPRQDIVPVKLKEGWNDLMLKVVDHEGGWNFCCRIRKPDGTALDGLKVEP